MTNSETEHQHTQPQQRPSLLKNMSRRLPTSSAQVLFFSIAIITFALDLLTKWAVFIWLKDRPAVPIIDGVVRFVTVYNNGAAFGLFAGHPNWLIAVSFFALAAIIGIFLFSDSKEKIMHVALALFAAGVCGNLYDRLFNDGLVRDFIDVGINENLRWPAFNLADAFLCVAVGLFMIDFYLIERPFRKRARQQK